MRTERERKKETKITLNTEVGKKEESTEAVMRSSAGLHCSTSAGDISSASGSQPPHHTFTFIFFLSPPLLASFWSSGLCSDQVLIFKNMYCLYEPLLC